MKSCNVAILAFLLCSCATKPFTYQPPSPAKLNQSTQDLSNAVNTAHGHAKQAQTNVSDASKKLKEVQTETLALKDVPPTLLEKIADLTNLLAAASTNQGLLEIDLTKADTAKAQVEKDKAEYFSDAQKLANTASQERDQRIKDEKALSWYRWHWWGAWIVTGLGVLAFVLLWILKIAGKLSAV